MVSAPDSHPAGILLFRTDPDLNMHRYYAMSVQPDLFGGVRLVREWGRRGTFGRTIATHHLDEAAANVALEVMRNMKLGRGYSPIHKAR